MFLDNVIIPVELFTLNMNGAGGMPISSKTRGPCGLKNQAYLQQFIVVFLATLVFLFITRRWQ